MEPSELQQAAQEAPQPAPEAVHVESAEQQHSSTGEAAQEAVPEDKGTSDAEAEEESAGAAPQQETAEGPVSETQSAPSAAQKLEQEIAKAAEQVSRLLQNPAWMTPSHDAAFFQAASCLVSLGTPHCSSSSC